MFLAEDATFFFLALFNNLANQVSQGWHKRILNYNHLSFLSFALKKCQQFSLTHLFHSESPVENEK